MACGALELDPGARNVPDSLVLAHNKPGTIWLEVTFVLTGVCALLCDPGAGIYLVCSLDHTIPSEGVPG